MDPPAGPRASSRTYDYDLVVIGGSSGGLAVAQEASELRRKVLILDLEAPSAKGTKWGLGGSGVNSDSVRRLLHQACILGKSIKDSEKYGWSFKEPARPGWAELLEAVQQQVACQSQALKADMRSCGLFYLQARGAMLAPHTVEATDVDGRRSTLSAETVVIATGDRPQYVDVPGGRELCLTSDDLFALPRSPGRTLVVGGTAEGLECAGFLSGLGLRVTVLPQPELLPGFDRGIAEMVENHMLVHGVDYMHHHSLSKVEQVKGGSKDIVSGVSEAAAQQVSSGSLRVTFVSKEGDTRQEEFDTVLLAVGRKACTSDIGLERVGVKCSPDTGRILVNDRDQTSVDHVYAVGSVQHGRPSTTGLSVHAGRLLARRLYRGDDIVCDYSSVPTVVFTPLEYAACGLSEERANLTFGQDNIEVYHDYYWPLEWTIPGRDKNSCYVKVVCHIPNNERVLGLHVMGPNAGDIVQGFVAAMKCGLTKQQLDATVGLHPVSAKVLTTLTWTRRMSEAAMQRGGC
ncbi:thioredoxin reductase 1, cytoplasmic-like [Myripristis murdjan]|uniref:thioredoxin reductase 1, cytoplasmic-like n=1 Tax=Myripristis murdjan TaxID=586833 RepID=UPI0011762B6D|nr:thioredoxin reductase 1, cytoplasmic-like [Myripristis murdjan]